MLASGEMMAQRFCSREFSKGPDGHVVRSSMLGSLLQYLARPALAAAVMLAGAAGPTWAATACKPVSGMNASIDKFIDEIQAFQTGAGQGTLPIADALFGFERIDPTDQRNLGERTPIMVKRQDEQEGIFVNQGPKPISIAGNFADSTTYFDIPQLVSGSYISTPDSLTLIYDPAHAVKVGQDFLGMKISKTINHTVITRNQLLYFFDSNSGDEPDRCYTLVGN
jgi:hypothetical protein